MPKIAEIHTIAFRLPLTDSLSRGTTSDLDPLAHILVRLVTDTGHIGLATATPRPTIYGETPESIQAIIENHLAPKLRGMDLADIDGINRQIEVIPFIPCHKKQKYFLAEAYSSFWTIQR